MDTRKASYAEDSVSSQESIDGPPSRNLRKNSGRQQVSELNMATPSNKGKNRKKANKLKDDKTPSVKNWFGNEDRLGQGNILHNAESDSEDYSSERSSKTVKKRGAEASHDHDHGQEYSYGNDSESGVETYTTTDVETSKQHDDVGNMHFSTSQPPEEEWSDNDEDNALSRERNRAYRYKEMSEEEGDHHSSSKKSRRWKQTKDERPLSFEEMVAQTYKIVIELQKESKNNKMTKANQEYEIEKLKDRLDVCEERLTLLTNIVIQQDKIISTIGEKQIKAEKRSMKENLIVDGIIEAAGEKCEEVAAKFFKDIMKIEKTIGIKIAHRIGKGEKRPMVIQLVEASQKGVMLKHAKNLKQLKNADGDAYYVKDQLPEVLQEEHNRKKEKVKYNKTLIPAQQQTIEWKKGELMIEAKY